MRPFILRMKGVKEDHSGEGVVLTGGMVTATIFRYGKATMHFGSVAELERHLIDAGDLYEISFYRLKYMLTERDFDKVTTVKTTQQGTSRTCKECGRVQLWKSNGYWQRVHNSGCSKARVRKPKKAVDPAPDYLHYDYQDVDRRTCKECRASQTLTWHNNAWVWLGGHVEECSNTNAPAPTHDDEDGGACTGGSYVSAGHNTRKCKQCLAVQVLDPITHKWTGNHNPGCSTAAMEVRNEHRFGQAQAS